MNSKTHFESKDTLQGGMSFMVGFKRSMFESRQLCHFFCTKDSKSINPLFLHRGVTDLMCNYFWSRKESSALCQRLLESSWNVGITLLDCVEGKKHKVLKEPTTQYKTLGWTALILLLVYWRTPRWCWILKRNYRILLRRARRSFCFPLECKYTREIFKNIPTNKLKCQVNFSIKSKIQKETN